MISTVDLHNSVQKYLSDLFSISVYHSSAVSLASKKSNFISWEFQEIDQSNPNHPEISLLLNIVHRQAVNAIETINLSVKIIELNLLPGTNVEIYDTSSNYIGSMVVSDMKLLSLVTNDKYLIQPVVLRLKYGQIF